MNQIFRKKFINDLSRHLYLNNRIVRFKGTNLPTTNSKNVQELIVDTRSTLGEQALHIPPRKLRIFHRTDDYIWGNWSQEKLHQIDINEYKNQSPVNITRRLEKFLIKKSMEEISKLVAMDGFSFNSIAKSNNIQTNLQVQKGKYDKLPPTSSNGVKNMIENIASADETDEEIETNDIEEDSADEAEPSQQDMILQTHLAHENACFPLPKPEFEKVLKKVRK
ncbi:hypothetical protein A3Q56_06470, partial [Intoshia linei]